MPDNVRTIGERPFTVNAVEFDSRTGEWSIIVKRHRADFERPALPTDLPDNVLDQVRAWIAGAFTSAPAAVIV